MRSILAPVLTSALLLSVGVPTGCLMAQARVPMDAPDSAVPSYGTRPVEVLPGAIFPTYRVVAYYGNPMSTRMGILGELPPEQMLNRLAATARDWQRADSLHPVKPALQLIVTVAQGRPGSDAKYRLRHSDSLIARVAGWAERRGYLLVLDVQVGQSTVEEELPRLEPWLRKPWVHLALDPEFAMPNGHIPGRKIGTLDAKAINYAVDFLARIVDEEHLPPKALIVHRFTENMLTNAAAIRADPRVQVVIDMDGFGTPALKKRIFDLLVRRRPVQFAGIKLFYKNDHPMLTLREVLALIPVPLYIQYQ
jgi:hypothetical protein